MPKMTEEQLRDFLIDLDEGSDPVEEVAAQKAKYELVGETKKTPGKVVVGKDGKWKDTEKESGKKAVKVEAKPAVMKPGISDPEIGEALMGIPFDAEMDKGLVALGLLDPKTLASMTGKGPLSSDIINKIIEARNLWPEINELRQAAGAKGKAQVDHNRALEKLDSAMRSKMRSKGTKPKGRPFSVGKGLHKGAWNAGHRARNANVAWERIQQKYPELAKIAWRPKAIAAAHSGIEYEAKQQAARVRDNQAGYGPGKGLKHSGAMKLVGGAMLPLGALHAIGFGLNYESDAAAMDSDRKLNTFMSTAAGRTGKPAEDLNMQDMMEEAYELALQGKGPWIRDGEVRPEMMDLYNFMQEHGVGVAPTIDETGVDPGPSRI